MSEQTGLQCPECGSSILRVSRTVQGEQKVLRERKCRNGHMFITSEEVCDKTEYNRIDRIRRQYAKLKA